MLIQFFIGALLIGATVIIHATVLDRLIVLLKLIGPFIYKHFGRAWNIPILVMAALGVFGAHVIEIWLWAMFYLSVDALHGLEEALYFSTATFTTVGWGDVVLTPDWRLISSFQSVNGFLLFGWSTAFIFEVMARLYGKEPIRKTDLK